GGQALVIAEGPFVRVLEANTGRELGHFKGQEYHLNSMAVAGDRVAVTGGDSKIHVWNLKNAKKVLTFTSHKNGSQKLRISPDGRYLAATGDDVGRLESLLVPTDYSVRVWDAATGKPLAPFVNGLRTGLGAAFSPDGRRLAWHGFDGVHVCQLDT